MWQNIQRIFRFWLQMILWDFLQIFGEILIATVGRNIKVNIAAKKSIVFKKKIVTLEFSEVIKCTEMKCSEDCLNIDYVFRKISVSSLSPNLCIFDWMPWKRNLFTISKNASLITIHEHRLVSNPNIFFCFISVSWPVSEIAEKLFSTLAKYINWCAGCLKILRQNVLSVICIFW